MNKRTEICRRCGKTREDHCIAETITGADIIEIVSRAAIERFGDVINMQSLTAEDIDRYLAQEGENTCRDLT